MPIYEFYSPDTHKVYSFYARSQRYADIIPCCPDGSDKRMQKRVSAFAFLQSVSEEPGDLSGDDAAMESALNELESEFRGIDEHNPDPRQLGQMMRRMQEVTGHRLPQSMQEMMTRLEKGENPENLEEMFGGDLEEEMGEYAGERHEAPGTDALQKILRQARRLPPARDPELYEFTDYLPES